MSPEKLRNLQITDDQKLRRSRPLWIIFGLVAFVFGAAAWWAWPRVSNQQRVKIVGVKPPTNSAVARASGSVIVNQPGDPPKDDGTGVILTVSGYIINRERIEISPRYLGVVKWIGVKKGDAVTNGQVVVMLDDAEYRAKLREAEGRVASLQAAVSRAQLDFDRISELARTDVESRKSLDDARLILEAAKADVIQAEGVRDLARTYLDWTVIRSPINGLVVEKLVNPNELVVPQSFGGTRGPSTALIAVADPKDLQVEIDMNEADLSKIALGQQCRVSPEAYLDKHYEGRVDEIAPEANRSKGTLQIKVQILNPDRYLTPELSAKVEFLQR